MSPPALTHAQLDGILERFVVKDYHARPHSETAQPPVTRWLADGWLPRLPTHPEDLDLLLLTAVTGRKAQRDGIRFASTRYVSPVLTAYVGETVTVRYDPRDAAKPGVYHHDQYLCRAIAPELAADTVNLQQLQQARTARRRQLQQQLRDRRSLADGLPADQRHLPTAPAAGPEQGPLTVAPAPAHRPRTYAPTEGAAARSLLGKNDDGRRFLTAAIGELGGHPPTEPPAAALFPGHPKTAGSPSSPTLSVSTATSACAGDRPASARRCSPAATPACRTGSSGNATSTPPTPPPAPDRSRPGSCRHGHPAQLMRHSHLAGALLPGGPSTPRKSHVPS